MDTTSFRVAKIGCASHAESGHSIETILAEYLGNFYVNSDYPSRDKNNYHISFVHVRIQAQVYTGTDPELEKQ